MDDRLASVINEVTAASSRLAEAAKDLPATEKKDRPNPELRPAPGKEQAKVYDYVDVNVGPLVAAAKARQGVYEQSRPGDRTITKNIGAAEARLDAIEEAVVDQIECQPDNPERQLWREEN